MECSSPPPSSGTARRAVIDVGTNSVKLLVADLNSEQVIPVVETGIQTRLGEGFYETNRLIPAAIERTTTAIVQLLDSALTYKPEFIQVIATSAARDAKNRQELLDAIRRQTGHEVRVLSGELEAELAFRGAVSQYLHLPGPKLIMDVGGGSTELIVGQGGSIVFRESYPLGAVRLFETYPPNDIPGSGFLAYLRSELSNYLRATILPELTRVLPESRSDLLLIGTGGTAGVLGRVELGLDDFDRDKLESLNLSSARVSELLEEQASKSLSDRKKIRGLPEQRADIFLFGTAIFEAVMRNINLPALKISTRGLRFGAVCSTNL
jgi:exopolyphosphatase/guanosine-5'-triphosphate,3'-diphosphate pyrophosphatase